MRILVYVFALLWISANYDRQDPAYGLINDLIMYNGPNLPLYVEFETKTPWTDIIQDPKHLEFGYYCLEPTDLRTWFKSVEWLPITSKLKKPEKIKKRKINSSITLTSKKEEEMIIISKPIIIGDRAAIYRKETGKNFTEHILFLEKKGNRWNINCRFPLVEQFVDE